MKSINQSVEVVFNAIDFSDAVIILPIMDDLISKINEKQKAIDYYNNNPAKDNKEPNYVNEYKNEISILIKQYNVLSRIGFVSQIDFIPTVTLS